MGSERTGHDTEGDLAVEDEQSNMADYRRKYAVILHNDDYTTMDCVVEILEKFFEKSHDKALEIMLLVHQKGRGVAGAYIHEIAETKANQAMGYARERGFPLLCTVEGLDGE